MKRITSIDRLEARRLLATISGTAKQDYDGNGIGDSWFAGAEVWIDLDHDRMLGPADLVARTDESATYTFNNLLPAMSALILAFNRRVR